MLPSIAGHSTPKSTGQGTLYFRNLIGAADRSVLLADSYQLYPTGRLAGSAERKSAQSTPPGTWTVSAVEVSRSKAWCSDSKSSPAGDGSRAFDDISSCRCVVRCRDARRRSRSLELQKPHTALLRLFRTSIAGCRQPEMIGSIRLARDRGVSEINSQKPTFRYPSPKGS